MIDICTGCGKEKFLVNKTHNLCDGCNFFRLHGKTRFEAAKEKQSNKPQKVYKLKRTPLKPSKNNQYLRNSKLEKVRERINKDRETYFKVFSNRPNKCENCDSPLPNQFEDEDGNIMYISQFSHILGKGAFPEYRHEVWNFNRLCHVCHQVWDFGDKKSMKIYEKNKKTVFENTGKEIL